MLSLFKSLSLIIFSLFELILPKSWELFFLNSVLFHVIFSVIVCIWLRTPGHTYKNQSLHETLWNSYFVGNICSLYALEDWNFLWNKIQQIDYLIWKIHQIQQLCYLIWYFPWQSELIHQALWADSIFLRYDVLLMQQPRSADHYA